MANSGNVSIASSQQERPWSLRHDRLLSLLIFILTLAMSVFFTGVLKQNHPYLERNIPKIIANIATATLLALIAKMILVYINGVVMGLHYIKTQLKGAVEEAIGDLTEITKGTVGEIGQNTDNSLSRIEEFLSKHGNTIAETYYRGFYMLLSDDNAREGFENLEKRFHDAIAVESPLRGVLLDFVVSSLASIGKNGFIMVDAKVDSYVKYIAETVQKAEKAVMTCVVRPYWFVVDAIRGISLPPYKHELDEYGKGEHLKFFNREGFDYQRWLIVDEHILAEMLLSAYIDRYLVENVGREECPVCNACDTYNSLECPFHGNRIDMCDIDDIPEIWWFKKAVNAERGVKLIYTLLRVDRRAIYEELEDRVFIFPQPNLDIRFSFSNLESGILRIRWGEEAQPLAWVRKFHMRLDPLTGEQHDRGHRFYECFREVLKDDLKDGIKKHLELLESLVVTYFDPASINRIEAPDALERGKLLAAPVKALIDLAIKQLVSDLDKSELSAIYDSLITFYKGEGIPLVAYVVTYDPLHAEYPVRIARWKSNWEEILNVPS